MIDQGEPDRLDPASLLSADRLISRQLWKAIGISTQYAPTAVSFCLDCGTWGYPCVHPLDPAQQAPASLDSDSNQGAPLPPCMA